jgi:bisphosphoglycerate-dependent phosphoglycerate mutase
MSTLSLPSQSFTAASPLSAFLATVTRNARSAWKALVSQQTAEPRTIEEVRAWARSLEAHQPAFAAELDAVANRADISAR